MILIGNKVDLGCSVLQEEAESDWVMGKLARLHAQTSAFRSEQVESLFKKFVVEALAAQEEGFDPA